MSVSLLTSLLLCFLSHSSSQSAHTVCLLLINESAPKACCVFYSSAELCQTLFAFILSLSNYHCPLYLIYTQNNLFFRRGLSPWLGIYVLLILEDIRSRAGYLIKLLLLFCSQQWWPYWSSRDDKLWTPSGLEGSSGNNWFGRRDVALRVAANLQLSFITYLKK